ncbi:class I SAM-dependent RNA methyltransferase [Nesterenkonia ebinurensis]|uniref:class I SAM-dependent RNA methyltransferase n=1 Tax=Nesterenkonia ebinurensis TaxID=2608252 RepID=UPI00123D6D5B|nr:TRAM domain-containing protein [Nesterenkonia ebinurensis]
MTGPRVLTLTVGTMSHGGHCVARHEGRVVFVRHAVPGETVRAVITDGQPSARFWRADVIDVLEASDHRRRHPWKQADALRAYDNDQVPVGGADYGHITDGHQRRLKSHVFRDTMQRIGNIDVCGLDLTGFGPDGELPVQQLPGADGSGMHWRTRVSFGVSGGSLAMKPKRSNDLIPLRAMPLAVEAVGASGIFSWDFTGAATVEAVAPGGQAPITLLVRTDPDAGDQQLRELGENLLQYSEFAPGVSSIIRVTAKNPPKRRRHSQLTPVPMDYQALTGDRMITEPLPVPVRQTHAVELPPEGFWQIHRSAPQALTEQVDRFAQLGEGGSAVDLYAGAGLFTAWAASTVGPRGQVLSVEAAEATSAAAQELFRGAAGVEVIHAPAEKVASRLESADVVVLDPPRAGAAASVLQGISDSQPGRIVYVSCDPASFARDARRLSELGWQIRELALLDMYPNTHHMESVALFGRYSPAGTR